MKKAALDIARGNALMNKTNEFAEAYRADADLRARAETEPRTVLAQHGLDNLAPPSAEVRIVADTDDTIHFILPAAPNAEMADEELGNIVGGFCLGSAAPTPDPDWEWWRSPPGLG